MGILEYLGIKTRGSVVVAALQSPHLLNIWNKGEGWQLFYDLLGDHDGLEESKDLEVPGFTSSGYKFSNVSAVLVTTPLQLNNARRRYPRAKIFWVVHTGTRHEVFPAEHVGKIDGIVTLSKSVQKFQLSNKPKLSSKLNFILTPYYEVDNVYQWKPSKLWVIRSRLHKRDAVIKGESRLLRVIDGIKSESGGNLEVDIYGQDSPSGYIDAFGKRELYRGSAAYISALPEGAGFGLAEHEALAHGLPVVGSRWGDMGNEMPESYDCLVNDESDMIKKAIRLSRNVEYANCISDIGMQYIKRHRSKESMNNQISEFISTINSKS